MTYEQFENQLQDLLDEGRLDEAEQLLGSIHPEDRPRCAELLATYRALFCGLPGALRTIQHESPISSAGVMTDRGRSRSPLTMSSLALALSLTLWVMFPSLLHDHAAMGPQSVSLGSAPPTAKPASEIATLEELGPQKRHFTRFATSSFQPLAQDVVTRTDSAIKSIERLAGNLNPIDEHLAAYHEAAPVISTLARGLLPGTHSLGDAFSVLQESALKPTGPVSPTETNSGSSLPVSTRA